MTSQRKIAWSLGDRNAERRKRHRGKQRGFEKLGEDRIVNTRGRRPATHDWCQMCDEVQIKSVNKAYNPQAYVFCVVSRFTCH